MPTKVIAFDLSLARTGWAADCGAGVESGAQSFPRRKGHDPADRYNDFETWLNATLDLQEPTLCVFEQSLHHGTAATEAAYGLVTRLKAACARRGIAYDCLYSTALKKFATGSGTADKAEMKLLAALKWPHYDSAQDVGGDEADSLWLLHWAVSGRPKNEPKKKKRKAKVL